MGNIQHERFSSGNHVRVYLSGTGRRRLIGDAVVGPLGKGTNLSAGVTTGARPVHVIGDPEPQDIVDGAYAYTIRLDTLRFRAEEPDGPGMVAAERVDIVGVDRFNGKRVIAAEECQLVDGTVTVPANNPVARNLTFSAMRIVS